MQLTPEQDRLINRILFWGGWTMAGVTLILELMGVFRDVGIILAVLSTGIGVLGMVRGASQTTVVEVKGSVNEVREGVLEVKRSVLGVNAGVREVGTGVREVRQGVAEVRDRISGLQAGQAETNRLLRSIDAKLGPAPASAAPEG